MQGVREAIEAVALSCLAVFLPVKAIILAAMVICLVDLLLGAWAAKKRGEAITSKGFARTIVKITVYEVAICAGFIVQKYLLSDSIAVVNLLGGLIGLTEMKSVLENLDTINGDSFFKSIITALGSKSDKVKSED